MKTKSGVTFLFMEAALMEPGISVDINDFTFRTICGGKAAKRKGES
jgi:hypothetical protein